MTFKPKRSTGAELAQMLEPLAAAVPPAIAERPAPAAAQSRFEPTAQINFRVSVPMAKLIARLAAEAGGKRRLFAQLLHGAGHDVPDVDLNPPTPRPTYD
jgi:hypothetical protein